MRSVHVYCLIMLAAALPGAAVAQTQYPNKPIRLIVNFPPGSSADMVARTFAPRLSEALGQSIVIDNRGGVAGNIGTQVVARSAPDGYTLLHSGGSPIVIGPHLYKLGFNVDKDLVPVAPTVRATIFLVVRPGLPIRSVAELIAHARANPSKLNFGSAGNGSTQHIAAEMLMRAARIQFTLVPYKGAALVFVALLGGEVDFTFDTGPAIPSIKTGKLRLLAVASAARSPIFPDMPTMAEAGTDVNISIAQGVYAPAGTPREIVMRLNREIGRILQSAEARAALLAIGGDVITASPHEFAALQRSERERFGAIIREANIRAD